MIALASPEPRTALPARRIISNFGSTKVCRFNRRVARRPKMVGITPKGVRPPRRDEADVLICMGNRYDRVGFDYQFSARIWWEGRIAVFHLKDNNPPVEFAKVDGEVVIERRENNAKVEVTCTGPGFVGAIIDCCTCQRAEHCMVDATWPCPCVHVRAVKSALRI